MKVFNADYLGGITADAQVHSRKRQHRNIHDSYEEDCQRLFNAIEPGSYIRPHRHATDPKNELLVAVRGLMALVTFDDAGQVQHIVHFGSEKYSADVAVGVEVTPGTWHTVLALVPGSVLLEVKAGPFDPAQPKDLATWAPEEGTPMVFEFVSGLMACVKKSLDIGRLDCLEMVV